MELNSYFRGLLSNIEPGSGAVKTAKKAHEDLREFLEEDEEISKADPETFLAGSYARDTALGSIKDVDVILIIDMDHEKTPPDVAVAWLQASLQQYYDTVKAQGRSVQVSTDRGFNLDVVPSVPLSHRHGPVRIPDREVEEWVATYPKGQIAAGVEKNKALEGLYKPLVKIVKYWRDRLPKKSSRAKSYIAETLVFESLLSTPPSYAQGTIDIFRSIYARYAPYVNAGVVPRISDPGYPSVNVAKRWKFQEFSDFMQETLAARDIGASALATADKDSSIRLWKKLFGEKFKPRE